MKEGSEEATGDCLPEKESSFTTAESQFGQTDTMVLTKGSFLFSNVQRSASLTVNSLTEQVKDSHFPVAGGWAQFVTSAFANNRTNLLTIPNSHLPNHYSSVAPFAPDSCGPLFCPAEVSKRRGAMSREFFLNSRNLYMSSLCPNSTEE